MKLAKVLLLLLALGSGGCSSPSSQPVAVAAPTPLSVAGLHNVFRVTERVYSGNSPEGAEGFQSLRNLGTQTIVSVDGAAPDVDAAKQLGMRYVHLPIGYDGISASRLIEIAKALRDSPGPVYVHCHHGKHRGPAAAIAAVRCLEGSFSALAARDFLKRAGTDTRYAGLYESAERTPPILDDARIEFREVAEIPDLTKRMVTLDGTWDRLKKKPDAKDAVLLVEQYREISRATKERNEDFRKLLSEALAAAEELEMRIHDNAEAEKAVKKSATNCANCHEKFRDRGVSSTP